MKLRLLGDVALVHGRSGAKGSYKGNDNSGQFRCTNVFAKRGGRWLAVATHSSKVEKH